MRALGLDLGTKRIGVAISNSEGTLATPYETIERTRDLPGDRRRIIALATEAEVEVIVVGMPLHLDGRMSESAKSAQREATALAAASDLPVETYDERLTTVSADRSVREMNLSPTARRKVIDQLAASIMLQAWLDHRANDESDAEQ